MITNRTATGGSWAALDPKDGVILWQTADPQVETLPAPLGVVGVWDLAPVSVANGVLYAASMAKPMPTPENPAPKQMFALDAATGKVLWQFAAAGSVNAGPAVVDGSVYWGSGYSRSVWRQWQQPVLRVQHQRKVAVAAIGVRHRGSFDRCLTPTAPLTKTGRHAEPACDMMIDAFRTDDSNRKGDHLITRPISISPTPRASRINPLPPTGRPTHGPDRAHPRRTEPRLHPGCGEREVFFHRTDTTWGTFNTLVVGDVVAFELIEDRVSGPRATRVRRGSSARPARARNCQLRLTSANSRAPARG